MGLPDDLAGQVREHLRFFAELGVEGVSRDATWRQRPAGREHQREADAPAETKAASADLAGQGTVPDEADVSGAAPPDSLEQIAADVGPDCSRCKLHTLGRTQIVFGVGNPRAELMFVGEAPGHDEDLQGIPFVGRAGQLLTKIIEAIDLRREDVYIANIIKCRPPGNRNPEPDEVAACEPFLFRQVQAIGPRVIVALGTFAAQALLRTKDPISRLRGRPFTCGSAVLVPTFHPAYLLRNPSSKREVWEDMKRVRDLLAAGKGDGA